LKRLCGGVLVFALISSACGPSSDSKKIEPIYDKQTGRLQVLKYDSDGDGKVDTISHMDGARVLRIDIDKDEDAGSTTTPTRGWRRSGSRAQATGRKTRGHLPGLTDRSRG
jgi:hypothetical protein